MSTQYIQGKYAGTEKTPTAIHNDAVGRSIIKYLPKNAGIAYDLADGTLKFNANGTIKTITASTATLFAATQADFKVETLDLDGSMWHDGIGEADRLVWNVPADVIITRIIVHTSKPSDKPMVATVALWKDEKSLGTLLGKIDLGSGPVTISNLDGGSHRGGKKGKKGEDDDDADETRRELFAPKESILTFSALDNPIGLKGTAYIFYFAL